MLAADKDHIDRAKAKAQAVKEAKEQARKVRQHRAVEQARATRAMRSRIFSSRSFLLLYSLWTSRGSPMISATVILGFSEE